MAAFETLSELVGALYEAALESNQWNHALKSLGLFVGRSDVVVVSAYNPLREAHLFESVNYDLSYWIRVQSEHCTPETNRYIDLISAADPGQVLQPRTMMSISEWLDDPIYRKFLRPDGLGDGLTCPLYRQNGGFAAIATFRRQHYNPDHLQYLMAAAPHVRHALLVKQRLSEADDQKNAIFAVLDKLKAGVLICDTRGHIIHGNTAAQRLLSQRDGLMVGRSGLLHTSRAEETAALLRHIHAAGTVAVQSSRSSRLITSQPHLAGGAMRLTRSHAVSPLEALIAPLRLSGYGPGSVVIFLTDAAQGMNSREVLARQLYGLTGAKTRLTLKLCSGLDLPDAARELGVTINTAKTLLSRAFERTGTNRQSELTSVIMRGPLGILAFDGEN